MMRKYGVCVLLLFLVIPAAFAQDEDLRQVLDYKINKMQKELHLTDTQADAIRPIIKDYILKRQALLQEIAGQGIVDHSALKVNLKGLKDMEHQKLSKVLSEDQMKKLINKETVMAALNPDSGESTADDDGPTLTASGADFKF